MENHVVKTEQEHLPPRSSSATEWQPIETAPKDGTRIIGFIPKYGSFLKIIQWGNQEDLKNPEAMCWRSDEEGPGYFSSLNEATHWMPLPEPPANEE